MQKKDLLFAVIAAGLLASSPRLSAQSVTLAWYPSASPDVVDYVVHYGGTSGNYSNTTNVSNQTSAKMTGLQSGQTYYFAVTARDAVGVESAPSNEASYQVPVTTLPAVALTSPVNGTGYTAPATVNLAASVTANGHTISKVQFYNGATLLGEGTSSPYVYTWNSVSAGSYSLTARVVYDAGSTLDSTAVNVTVTNLPPTIVLTSPATGTSYAAPATVNLAASVTANGHTITKVQFYNGATLLSEDTSSPYSFAWGNVSAGSYSLTARLVYDAGSTVASSAANVTVSNPPPLVALTSPSAGANYTAPAAISLTASVTANGHAITKVQFYNGATLLGESASAPYLRAWTNVGIGNYTVSARTYYDSGSTADSSPVNIAVTLLPPPWQTADIGIVALAGNAGESNGVYTLQGSGNIASKADSFLFVYQPLSGDGDITVRINSMATNGVNRCVGVMIRESLAPNSRYSFTGIGQNLKFRSQRRNNTGGNTSSTTSALATPPNAWARLVRASNTLATYSSPDGTNWTKLTSASISMATNIYVGLVVASGDTNTVNTSVFSNVSVTP